MHVSRSTDARSFTLCSGGKAISITHSECVSVALVIQHAMRMRHIIMWPARLYNIFPRYLINGMILEKKKKLLKVKYVF